MRPNGPLDTMVYRPLAALRRWAFTQNTKIDPVQFRLHHVHKRRYASQTLAGETASKYYCIVNTTFREILKPVNIT
jgi:hypothetical protein